MAMAELRFGLTAPAPCSYLGQQQEQLVFLLADQPISASLYQQLLQINFPNKKKRYIYNHEENQNNRIRPL